MIGWREVRLVLEEDERGRLLGQDRLHAGQEQVGIDLRQRLVLGLIHVGAADRRGDEVGVEAFDDRIVERRDRHFLLACSSCSG